MGGALSLGLVSSNFNGLIRGKICYLYTQTLLKRSSRRSATNASIKQSINIQAGALLTNKQTSFIETYTEASYVSVFKAGYVCIIFQFFNLAGIISVVTIKSG